MKPTSVFNHYSQVTIWLEKVIFPSQLFAHTETYEDIRLLHSPEELEYSLRSLLTYSLTGWDCVRELLTCADNFLSHDSNVTESESNPRSSVDIPKCHYQQTQATTGNGLSLAWLTKTYVQSNPPYPTYLLPSFRCHHRHYYNHCSRNSHRYKWVATNPLGFKRQSYGGHVGSTYNRS